MELKKVKVSPYVYDVVEDTALSSAAGVLGACMTDTSIILVDPAQSPAALRDTLLHEVLHACWTQTSLDKKYNDDEEEAIVASFSPRILAVLRDNPELVSYLLADDAPTRGRKGTTRYGVPGR